MKKQLDPGATWYFRFAFYRLFVFIFIFLIFFSIGFLTSGDKSPFLKYISYAVIFIIVMIIALGEIYSRMSYSRWFYEFTDEQLRLERGIIWKRYSNIPYERIQNVDITRGIIARICGFSTVMIQTAGYSAPNRNMMAEGYIPALSVQEAEHIREFIMKKITKKGRRQGL
ncbi:Bacterial PH domain protein [uncultured archaeon]|nr:Bacterial PH domain protein [uncultured archaeon]